MAKDACPFTEKLYLWQVDVELLDEEETEELLAHLEQDPKCPHCFAAIPENARLIRAGSDLLKEIAGKGD